MNSPKVLPLLLGLALTGTAFGQTGTIATIAGSWVSGFTGDNGAATLAELGFPNAVAVDAQGNVYFTDNAFTEPGLASPVGGYTPRIRKVNAATGIITTVAGNGIQGFSGDGGAATSAEFGSIGGLGVDGSGDLFIADVGNGRVRRVDASTGIIMTVAGGGSANPGDGSAAIGAALIPTGGLAVDGSGNLYIADSYVVGFFSSEVGNLPIYAYRIREVAAATGIISTIAGNGTTTFGGDGGPATSAELSYTLGLAVDSGGNLFIADSGNDRVRRVDVKTGIITTIAGTGTPGFSGDGGPATSAELSYPLGLAVDANGNLYFADFRNERIRMVAAATGVITTAAGMTCPTQFGIQVGCYSGDGVPATSAGFNGPSSVALDSTGNLYIADTGDNRIREVFFTSNPVIATLSQTSDPAGSISFTLTVNGANFVPGSTLNWSGTPRSTTFVSSTQLSALVTANLLANGGIASLTVTNPATVGGATPISNVATFTVVPFGPPLINLLSPSRMNSGSSGFTLAVFGEGFVQGSLVFWNGNPLSTRYVSSTILIATVPASLLVSVNVTHVTAANPGISPDSNFLPFTIFSGLAPTSIYSNPGGVNAGGPAFTLTVTEASFSSPASIYWNGVPLNTTYVNTSVNGVGVSGQLTATIPADFIAQPGLAVLTLGGGAPSTVFAIAAPASPTNSLSVPHIADGAGWTTTLVIENIDTIPVTFNFNFLADDGTALPLQVVNASGGPGYPAGSLYPGVSYFLQSTGTSPALLEGWAQVSSSGRLGVIALFNYTAPAVPDSQGSVSGQTSASAISMPYDNTDGYVMGVALANSNPTQTLAVALTFITDQGVASNGSITIPPNGHTAFVLPNNFPQTAGTRGGIQFTAPTPDLSVLGERFSPSLSFTTLGTFQ